MTRFRQILDAADDAALGDIYADMLRNGFGNEVPYNWFASQSTRPDILSGTWAITKNLLLEGELPAIVKQMILVTVSVQNNCHYCKCVHGAVLATLGVSEAVIESCTTDPELKLIRQPHRAILQFALKLAAEPGSIVADDFEKLRQRGITEAEILEIVALAAYCNFINTWADLSRIPVDRIGSQI